MEVRKMRGEGTEVGGQQAGGKMRGQMVCSLE